MERGIVLPKKTTIRQVNYEELIDVGELVLNTFVQEINDHIPELESPQETSVKKFVQYYINMARVKTPHCIFGVFYGDELVGAAGGHIKEHPWSNVVWAEEDFWFVTKEHREKKSGIKLYNELISWFVENGAERISMKHYEWNIPIRDFYMKNGFIPYERNYVKKLDGGKI
mgnify:CR=1 FL=1